MYSAIYALLNDKVGAIGSGQKAIDISKKRDERSLLEASTSNYAAIVNRFIRDHEADRLVQSAFELQKLKPESKIIWPIKPFDENKNLTPEFKKMLEEQRILYEGIRSTYLSSPVPIYLLEKVLKRSLIDLLSNNYDLEFTLEFNFNAQEYKDKSLQSLENSQIIVIDYLGLIDLVKTGLIQTIIKLGKRIIIHRGLFEKIQDELLEYDSQDLRRLWDHLRLSKNIEIIDKMYKSSKKPIFDKWLENSIELCKENNAIFLTSDLRLRQYLKSLNIDSINLLTVMQDLYNKRFLDERMYSSCIGKLAERLYVFLPFTGDDLFNIVAEDDFKPTLRSIHLLNQIYRPGSQVTSFMVVFSSFLRKLWDSPILVEDKVYWLERVTSLFFDLIKRTGAERILNQDQDISESIKIFAVIWHGIINLTTSEELILIENFINKNEYKSLEGFVNIINNEIEKKRLKD